MLYLLPLGLIVLTMAAAFLYGSRAAQLKNMARSLHLRYDKQIDSPLTHEAARHVHLFNRGLHQFYHVLTWKDPDAFIRVCDDSVFTSPLDKVPHQTFTLVTAELTRGTFPPFILMPRTNKSPSTQASLPNELAIRYTLTAPAGFQFPPSVQGLLKAGKPCFIETTENALVYHEYTTATLDQIQPMRFRVKQFVQQLRRLRTPVCSTLQVSPKTDAQLQAEVLLKLKSAARTTAPTASSRLLYGFILLIFLTAMCALAWFALQQVAPR